MEPQTPSDDAEAPEADKLEQAQVVVPESEFSQVSRDPETPEADALDQARSVPYDDELDR